MSMTVKFKLYYFLFQQLLPRLMLYSSRYVSLRSATTITTIIITKFVFIYVQT
jgi:hypothetical protein